MAQRQRKLPRAVKPRESLDPQDCALSVHKQLPLSLLHRLLLAGHQSSAGPTLCPLHFQANDRQLEGVDHSVYSAEYPGKKKRLFKRNLARTYSVTFKCE